MISILVVEDNYALRKGLVNTISREMAGFDAILEAPDGLNGMERACELQPDIVLTDIRLPGISGLEMIRRIQAVYRPISVVISGYSEFEYAKEALSLGVNAYLVKPIDEQELACELKKCADAIRDKQQKDRMFEREYLAIRQNDESDNNKHSLVRDHYVNRAIGYIHQHYMGFLTVSEIADAVEVSEGHLSRLFKEQTSCTIIEYCTNYRVEQAQILLADPKRKIYEIAAEVGFQNQRYFSSLFKRKTGLTPQEYRNRVLSGDKK